MMLYNEIGSVGVSGVGDKIITNQFHFSFIFKTMSKNKTLVVQGHHWRQGLAQISVHSEYIIKTIFTNCEKKIEESQFKKLEVSHWEIKSGYWSSDKWHTSFVSTWKQTMIIFDPYVPEAVKIYTNLMRLNHFYQMLTISNLQMRP